MPWQPHPALLEQASSPELFASLRVPFDLERAQEIFNYGVQSVRVLMLISRKRSAFSESFIAPSLSVSKKPFMDVIGVFSSCETFATKSRRMFSNVLRRVTSFNTISARVSLLGNPVRWRLEPEGRHPVAYYHYVAFQGISARKRASFEPMEVGVANGLLNAFPLTFSRLILKGLPLPGLF